MSNSGDVIDLTNSFILADHCGIANVIIDLDSDDSFCVDNDRREDRASVNTQCFAKGAKPSLRLTAIENTNKKKKAKQKSPTSIKAKETSSLPGNSKKFGGCPICWDELGKNPLASTKCGHVYCMKCIEGYLKVQKKCPTCRRSLKGSSPYHALYL
ncbi:E3 ubiquitin-protein ligase RNF4-like isoform X1 [Helicoverpa zea]|uniref:E3 ubiquitin-protein ligase RNF4-like isoform X1 n=1 Tax=Helicoverpa zea TaxID=7113 RepID=UPI001F56AB83|nr:E3 ubiquitin-protein ligase RNF4-like isoform X1 [Helicoverpa zea]